MALILQLETATSTCSVALSLNGKTLFVKELTEHNAHASNITLFVQDVFNLSGYKIADLDAVALSKGPGSYTGLRIGTSTAKGLCFGLDKPLIAINTLEAMAYAKFLEVAKGKALFCPMIDARRMEVYTALYNFDFEILEPVEAKIIDSTSFDKYLEHSKILFFGDGAMKCASLITHPNAVYQNGFENSAVHLSALAYNKYINNQFEDVAYFEPYYLKDFVGTKPKTS